jgi:hypothetical protein
MPNTGPGTDIFLIAFGAGLTTTIGNHLWLRHRARLSEPKL